MVLKILIAATAAGSIIGKGGSTINEFQETSGARIQLSRNGETFPGTTDRVISLGGGVADIVGAVHLMIQKLTQDGAELVEGEPRVRVVVPNAPRAARSSARGAPRSVAFRRTRGIARTSSCRARIGCCPASRTAS